MKWLKRLLGTIFLLASISSLSFGQGKSCGQVTYCQGTITTSGNVVTVSLPQNTASGVVTVSGTFSGTLQFEQANDGVNWTASNGTTQPSGSIVTSATAAGQWAFTIPALTGFRVRASALASGSAIVTVTDSTASGGGGGGGGGSGTVGLGSQYNPCVYTAAGTSSACSGASGYLLNVAAGTLLPAPTGTGVALTITGDSNNSNIENVNLAGGTGGNARSLDHSGNEILAGSLTTGGGTGVGLLSATEGVCSGAATGKDVLCANSSAHAFYVSYNNGAFGQLGATPTLNQVLDPTADKTFLMGTHALNFGTVASDANFSVYGALNVQNGNDYTDTSFTSSAGHFAGAIHITETNPSDLQFKDGSNNTVMAIENSTGVFYLGQRTGLGADPATGFDFDVSTSAPAGGKFRAQGGTDIYTSDLIVEVPNAGSTGTTLNKLAKVTAGAAVITTTSAADQVAVIGCVKGGAGTTGNAQIAVLGTFTCYFDNTATTQGDYVVPSGTTAATLNDAGSTFPSTGEVLGTVQETHSACGSPPCGPYSVLFMTPDVASQGAGNNGGGKGTSLQVNGTATKGVANLNGSTPAAGSNGKNVTWQASASGNTSSVSAEIVGDGNAAHYLDGTGAYSTPAGAGTVTNIATTAPLAGGPITTTGTISITGAAGQVLAGSTPAFTATPSLGTDNSVAGTLQLATSSANAHTIIASGATTSYTFKTPTTAGTNNYILQTDGSGNTSWVANSGGSRTVTTDLKFDQCTPGQTTNPGNSFWSVVALTNWDAGHWEFVKNTAADIFCSIRIPGNVDATPAASVIWDLSANDATSGHTDVFTIQDAITSSLNPQIGSLSASSNCTFTTTTTAYANTTCTKTPASTIAANQILVVNFHQAASNSVTANVIMQPPTLRITLDTN